MATYNFSALSDGQVIAFNPSIDVLVFDQTSISAADLIVSAESGATRIAVGTKDVLLQNTLMPQLATSNVSFANGSQLLFGDNSAGTAGDGLANSLSGTGGADLIAGFDGNDTIFANSGNDRIESGAGNDSISGGSGQDSYVFHEFGASNADTVLNFDTGWDKLQLDAAAFTQLGATGRFASGDVRFFAAAGASGGHDADDRIVYNTTTGQLFYDADGSGAGAAQLIATFQGAPALVATDVNVFGTAAPSGNTINGTSGNDTLVGTAGPDTLNGFAGDDSLFGAEGADRFNGGDGNDTMNGDNARFSDVDVDVETMDGGLGNDVYIVDNSADVLIDAGGTDTVRAFNISWTLAAGFENLEIWNGEAESLRNGIGNDANNVLDGSPGWHVFLDGRGGNDTILGSVQNDTLLGGDGNDFIDSGEDFDSIDGGAGDDTLDGGFSGDDTLTGGAGADHFVIDGGVNTITDFASGTDKLELDGSRLARTGPSGNFTATDERFYAAAGATAAHDSTDRVVYDTATGNVYYDPDGIGGDAAFRVATVSALTATDITVVSGNVVGLTINGTAGSDSLTGTAADDTINGLGGNDTIDGLAGDDVLNGGDGNDSITALGGFDSVSGGAGNDTIEANADAAIDGGLGDDTYLLPWPFGGTLVDAGGIDTVIAQNATLQAGLENLLLRSTSAFATSFGTGNELNNLIWNQGNSNESFIDGADGNDSLRGSSQTDHFFFSAGSGSIGNDTVDGDVGFDDIRIGEFSAVVVDFRTGTITGGGTGGSGSVSFTGIEAVFGGAFNDQLTADDAGRRLYGGNGGDDTLIGGAGNDTLQMMYFESGHDFLDGGAGIDTLEAYGAGAAVDLTAGTLSLGPSNSATFVSMENYLGTPYGADFIRGSSGANLLVGDFGVGNHGADTISGLGGNDTLVGGGGSDQFLFQVAPGAADADFVDDFIIGVDKAVLDGTVFANVGPSGNFAASDPRFFAAAGANSAHDADDRVIYNITTGQLWYDADGTGAGAAQLIATLDLNGATTISATDIAVINGSASGVTVNGTAGNDSLVGTPGNDTLNGFAGNDTLNGAGGADSMVGGDGDDLYFVDNAGDTVVETQNGGIDEVRASVSYTLPAWVNNLTLTGGAVSGTGNDIENVITGNDLDNVLDGGLGNDTIAAAGGADRILLGGAYGADSIDGGAGFDQVTFTSQASAVTVDMRVGTITGGGPSGSGSATVASVESIGLVPSSAFADRMIAGSTAMLFNGGGGDDTLLGGVGNDSLFGSAGNDSLTGGAGNDFLEGDAGADRFVFNVTPGAANADAINDFETGIDQIRLDATVMPALGASGAFGAGDARFFAAAGASGGHDADDRVVFDTSSGNLYYDADGSGAGAAQLIATLSFGRPLAATDIVVDNGSAPPPTGGQSISGTTGNDTLVGGSGNDTIFGNSGNDWIEGRGGNDTVSGGSGQDSYVFREFGTANADTLLNFDTAWDMLRLDASVFTALGGTGRFASGDARFFAGAGAAGGHDADDRIVYNTSTGQLYYDADGSGAGGAQLIATMPTGSTVVASDIFSI